MQEDSAQVESPAELAKRLSLKFKDLRLLTRALTHRSFVNEHPDVIEDNERLEFLGDAVLDFVVGSWLYKSFPELSEGDLTRMRSALVRTEQLAEFARTLDLGSAMRLGKGEHFNGGRERPALLCATFEALVGALYLQDGIPAVQAFMVPLLDEASDFFILQPDIYDPKSRLQEWAQGRKLGTPRYETIEVLGPDHARRFEVEVLIDGKSYGRGVGQSKQAAEQAAAQTAIESIGIL